MDNAAGALVNPGRVTAGGAARRASSALVVVEIALAIVLLTGAGLVLRSFARLLAVDPGFTRGARADASTSRCRPIATVEPPARGAFYTRAFDALSHLDGVESAGAAAVMPLTGNNWTVPFDRADRPVPAGQRPPDVGWQAASGGYFTRCRSRCARDGCSTPTDRPAAPPVVIISEAIRDRFFPARDPIGRKVRSGDGSAEIVGVVGNIRRAALTDEPRADMYFPSEQVAADVQTTLFIRTPGDPLPSWPAIRATLRGDRAADRRCARSRRWTRSRASRCRSRGSRCRCWRCSPPPRSRWRRSGSTA